ncbi:hypothetical protein ASF82_05345 [Frigoribacterium sp. Leaf164]|nr:hypothetical protein ASF82_05345 [Frigoribacterium sp. Leaf164]
MSGTGLVRGERVGDADGEFPATDPTGKSLDGVMATVRPHDVGLEDTNTSPRLEISWQEQCELPTIGDRLEGGSPTSRRISESVGSLSIGEFPDFCTKIRITIHDMVSPERADDRVLVRAGISDDGHSPRRSQLDEIPADRPRGARDRENRARFQVEPF